MSASQYLASPNSMVWNYSFALRRAVARTREEGEDSIRKQEAAVVVFLSVTLVEAFLNAYFRVLVRDPNYREHEPMILKDLKRPVSCKIRKWPKEVFGCPFDEERGIGYEFAALRKLRNELVHFESGDETFSHENVHLRGLANTTSYDTLSGDHAEWAQTTAEGVIEEIFRLRGLDKTEITASMHLWVGRVPV